MGFTKRVFPPMKSKRSHYRPHFKEAHSYEHDCRDDPPSSSHPTRATKVPTTATKDSQSTDRRSTRTELAFDFHRLNVLLLRAVAKDNVIVAKKIATATMSEAKVQATVGEELVVQGSLGGLQVLDLTPEGQTHQRILSLGQDPLVDQGPSAGPADKPRDLFHSLSADLYRMSGYGPSSESTQATAAPIDTQAFSFSITRPLKEELVEDFANVHIRLASVWYTHSARFLVELGSCAKEFNQYLTNLARSIGNAATEMAIGLVQTRAESLAQSLSMNGRISRYGSLSDVTSTPRKSHRRFSWSSTEQLDTNYTCGCNTPRDYSTANINIRLDLIMDSPVCVLPRNATSHQVFVAHLGRICLNKDNIPIRGDLYNNDMWTSAVSAKQKYSLEIRDMNLYSLNTKLRSNMTNQSEYELLRIDKLYSCRDGGKPVLHDTVIQLSIERETIASLMHESIDDLASDLDATGYTSSERQENFQVSFGWKRMP
ncbi:vacuolar protein sorting-associated protein 13D-like [Diaphorina citri]|uniref:Vacuolar protein sorting-associated protein 13D-like n=2 Tax=Diaphorina citri TaxID=121845 RepID=A0A3Q0J808_DIACI|nr:vacuolar protein sorting-associated protein 13D-like [Diaphorina citri]